MKQQVEGEPLLEAGTTLVLECDEAWSFVQKKSNKQWIWLAPLRCKGTENGRIVGCYVGDRPEAGAKGLWDSIPAGYRDTATFHTDFWDAYGLVLPQEKHLAAGKKAGKTNHIERFNGTLRARLSRLVRKSYAFSKKLQNHKAAIWNFIHYHNASLQV